MQQALCCLLEISMELKLQLHIARMMMIYTKYADQFVQVVNTWIIDHFNAAAIRRLRQKKIDEFWIFLSEW